MKRYIMCLLSFVFLFFSAIDLSSIVSISNFYHQNSINSKCNILSVQYDILKQTKQAFAGLCDDIIKNMNTILTTHKTSSAFFSTDSLYIQNNSLNYYSSTIFSILKKSSYTNISKYKDTIMLFFFIFVFLFILKYLGLLFTFGKINKLYINMKAYSL